MTSGQSLTAEPTFVRAVSLPDELPQAVSWTQAMRRAIRSQAELRRYLGLPAVASDAVAAAEQQFPTFVPLEFLARIDRGNLDDPLLRQVLAVDQESDRTAGFVADPVGDQAARVSPQLLQKYNGRALIITTGVCGVHCRYCFRRQYDYSVAGDTAGRAAGLAAGEPLADEAHWAAAMRYLKQHPSVDEVLLSGGDPLTLSDRKLFGLLEQLEAIPHLKRLRIHSRMPIVIPQRVTETLVQRLRASRLTTWLVVHCNHAQEIDAAVAAALGRCVDAGIPVLNQAVLLAGVNDSAVVLESLCRRLVDLRVQPYYLHQLDRVQGSAHFEVAPDRGRQLIDELRAVLPGYAVPSYVTEVAGAVSKVPN